MNGEAVHKASIDWVSLTIQKFKPGEAIPQQLAERMIQIAEEQDVGVEDVLRYVEHHEGPITTDGFELWAMRLREREEGSRTPRCAHCGGRIHTIEEARQHAQTCRGSHG